MTSKTSVIIFGAKGLPFFPTKKAARLSFAGASSSLLSDSRLSPDITLIVSPSSHLSLRGLFVFLFCDFAFFAGVVSSQSLLMLTSRLVNLLSAVKSILVFFCLSMPAGICFAFLGSLITCVGSFPFKRVFSFLARCFPLFADIVFSISYFPRLRYSITTGAMFTAIFQTVFRLVVFVKFSQRQKAIFISFRVLAI